MKQRDFMAIVSREQGGLGAALLRLLFRFASFWFWLAVRMRLLLYRSGLLGRKGVDVPVICVGNLTTGGTGKTPAVAWVVKALEGMGHKPSILSRGYKSDSTGNDEMKVLEELCPGVPHIQNPDRVAGARKAVHHGAKLIVLDDGFSHLRLKRDLDILLFDALNPFGFGRMLPRGLLREPLSSVRRAKFAIFSRAGVASEDRLRDLEDTIRCKGFVGGIAHAAHAPVRLLRVNNGEEASLEMLQGVTVAPFCGIGNPRGFERTLEKLGAQLTPLRALHLDDHQDFGDRVLKRQVIPFLRNSREANATIAVCTQKDAVKFRGTDVEEEAGMPIYELQVEFRIIKNEEGLLQALRDALERKPD
ncbi:MAG: tetraacyldisaccharide 4'-kinase [Planctomycetes bacterium]|nr:tetraacyldisaccharide 4'-kinase [Planctomycetota bacterium]MCB9935058.1 tetraacyldisaccharide 4'-kinase [Planctomycetota bacterium]